MRPALEETIEIREGKEICTMCYCRWLRGNNEGTTAILKYIREQLCHSTGRQDVCGGSKGRKGTKVQKGATQ